MKYMSGEKQRKWNKEGESSKHHTEPGKFWYIMKGKSSRTFARLLHLQMIF